MWTVHDDGKLLPDLVGRNPDDDLVYELNIKRFLTVKINLYNHTPPSFILTADPVSKYSQPPVLSFVI